jgi:hypothetical protein
MRYRRISESFVKIYDFKVCLIIEISSINNAKRENLNTSNFLWSFNIRFRTGLMKVLDTSDFEAYWYIQMRS